MSAERPVLDDDDVTAALLERRVLVVSGVLDVPGATELCAALLALDAVGDDAIELRLASCQGDLEPALSVVDVVDVVGVEVHATALGVLEGGPVAVLAASTRRRMAPHATLRLREPDVEVAGTATELERALAATATARRGFHELLARCTGRPVVEVEAEWSRGVVLEARDAVSLGYADGLADARRAPTNGLAGR